MAKTRELCHNFLEFKQTPVRYDKKLYLQLITYTVHPPICHTLICQQNPICQHFFGNENVTNRVRGFQKTK